MTYTLSIESYSLAPGMIGQDPREHLAIQFDTPLSAAIVCMVAVKRGCPDLEPERGWAITIDGLGLAPFAHKHGIGEDLSAVEFALSCIAASSGGDHRPSPPPATG